MAQKFSLKNAEQVRQTTTIQMQKDIKQMYEHLYNDVTKQIASMGNGNVQKQNLVLLKRSITKRIEQLKSLF